jgi:hypothetical protein
MASLLSRFVASFDAIKPVPNLTGLDGEFNQLEGASGCLNGNSTAFKLLIKSSDAADPPIECDQVGAGPLAEWKQNGSLKTSIANSGQIVSAVTTGTAPLSIASTTVVTNLNADLLDGRELVGLQVSFSVAFIIDDPSTATLNSRDYGSFIVPAGGTYTFTKGKVMFRKGSHTAGGSLTFKIDQSGVGDKSTLTLDNTNNTIGTVYEDNFGDFTAAENQIFTAYLSAKSGTITERGVAVVLEGFRTVF